MNGKRSASDRAFDWLFDNMMWVMLGLFFVMFVGALLFLNALTHVDPNEAARDLGRVAKSFRDGMDSRK